MSSIKESAINLRRNGRIGRRDKQAGVNGALSTIRKGIKSGQNG